MRLLEGFEDLTLPSELDEVITLNDENDEFQDESAFPQDDEDDNPSDSDSSNSPD